MKRTLASSVSGEFNKLIEQLYYCPACTTWRTPLPASGRIFRHKLSQTRRYASSSSSVTAVNGFRNVPPHNKPLYDALLDVRKRASAQLNLSRLQLAIQSLESEKPVIRVAIVGLNVSNTARRLVRLLLADALEAENQWEKQILQDTEADEQGLLIRYGHPPNTSLPQARTTIPILHIPATVLEKHNIEILITSIATPGARNDSRSPTTTSDTFLSPSVLIPTSAGGRQTVINQPVHNALVVAQGVDELLETAQLLAATEFTSVDDQNAVRVAADTALPKPDLRSKTMIMNIGRAEEGLAAIRRSVREAITYEHKWVDSGIPMLSQWLEGSTATRAANGLSQSTAALVSSLLDTAESNLEAQAAIALAARESQGLSIATQTNLDSAIETFSRNAHQELQSGLASAWSSRNWRKLWWYKLFWRVDDVGLIITDLVSNAWLPRTEHAVYEISGRLAQVGISPVEMRPLVETVQASVFTTTTQLAAEPSAILSTQSTTDTEPDTEPVVANPVGKAVVTVVPVPQPKPIATTISEVRDVQIQAAIGDMTTIAQQLVFRTLSITGLSVALSGLTYVSLTPGSLYEAGTIAAVGIAYALWKMQGDWQKATKALENSLFVEGRNIIQHITRSLRGFIEATGKVEVDDVEMQTRVEAGKAVSRAREELEKLR